jgi:hypothetical protein
LFHEIVVAFFFFLGSFWPFSIHHPPPGRPLPFVLAGPLQGAPRIVFDESDVHLPQPKTKAVTYFICPPFFYRVFGRFATRDKGGTKTKTRGGAFLKL